METSASLFHRINRDLGIHSNERSMYRLSVVADAVRAYVQFQSVITTGNAIARANGCNEHRFSTDCLVACGRGISSAMARSVGSGGHRRLDAVDSPATRSRWTEVGRMHIE